METVELYKGICFDIPNTPPLKTIQGYNLPEKEQKWKRTPLPENFDEIYEELDALEKEILEFEKELEREEKKNATAIKKKKQPDTSITQNIIECINERVARCNNIDITIEKFALEENRKCTDGHWFFNKGVPTYITGDHYFYINWFKIDIGFPNYKDIDRRWFYHWFVCDNDDRCIGQAFGKKRRDGFSFRAVSNQLNRARKTKDAEYGIVSKTGDDAKGMFNKLIVGFMNLPRFFKPQVATAEDIKNDLWFKTPQQKVTYRNRTVKKEFSLNTKMSWKAANDNAYDSTKQYLLAADEVGKWEEADVQKWFSVGKICLVDVKAGKNGKMLFGSTVNESTKGGAGFEIIYKNSNPRKRTLNDRTTSGLYQYFVPAYDGLTTLDGSQEFVDEYGHSVIDTPEVPTLSINGKPIKKGARQYLADELTSLKEAGDMVAYYEQKRMFPLTEEDMFANPANEKVVWDLEKIYQQIEHNDIHVIENTLHYGYFQWIGGVRDNPSGVEWITTTWDSELCKFCFSWFPPEQERNKWILKRDGFKHPANTHKGLFTLDPYAAVNTVDPKRQSKAASHGIKKYDVTHKIKHKHFISEYWKRLKDPLLVYEDMIMCCIYFGWGLMPERNIKNCNDYFRGRDYHKYILPSPSMTNDDYIDSLTKNIDGGVANTDGKTRNQFVEYLASWITNYCGVNERTGEMGFMPFNNTLKDWLAFDIDKWTPYDLTVSSMVGMVGADAIVEIKRPERKQYNFFKQYEIKKGHRFNR